MTVARAALKELRWSNKATFKFNSYATQTMRHFETLEQGGQGVSDQEKVMRLLESMNTQFETLHGLTHLAGEFCLLIVTRK